MALCVALAIAYLVVARRYYAGSAQLWVKEAGSGMMGNGQDLRSDPNAETFLYTQCEVVTSTPVLAMTLSRRGFAI